MARRWWWWRRNGGKEQEQNKEEEEEEVAVLSRLEQISRPFLELVTKWKSNLRGACSKQARGHLEMETAVNEWDS